MTGDAAARERAGSATSESAGASRPAPFYRPELDGLRFFAFFMVYWSHALPTGTSAWARLLPAGAVDWALAFVRMGAWGVDLFFVLSSYLITELLLREREEHGRVDVGAFWIRRILRIWPLYFAFLAVVFTLVPRILNDHVPRGYALAFLTFTANWAMASWGLVGSVAMPLWSVSVEEQFYLVWPVVARHLPARRLAVFSACLVPVGVLVRCLVLAAGSTTRAPAVWCNTLSRLDPIALGAILAVVLRGARPRWSPAVARLVVGGAVTVLLLVARFELSGSLGALGGSLLYLAAALACAAAIAAVLALGSASAFARPSLVYLGRISYGLYVFHLLGLRLAGLVGGGARSPVWLALLPPLGFVVTLLLAAASFRWLERPFLRLKRRVTRTESAPID